MAGRKSDFTLSTKSLDDLFSTQEEQDEAKLAKIYDIPLELIDDFPDHPFKVRDDEDMTQLVESIKERGVITPATVTQKEDGRYELVSGHRRKRACELAGFETLRCEVVELNRDEATILMVESNFQRSQMADEYLSGNVREKITVAKRSAEVYPEDYTVNVKALEKVQPKDLTASEIYVRLGATWLPPEIVEQFMFELLDTPRYNQ